MYDPEELVDLLSPDLAGCVGEIVDEHRSIYENTTLTDHVNRMCLADARLFLPGLNLTYTDRASMAASTEVRVPFVDTEVVRAAFSQPGSAKISHGRGKIVLKEAALHSLPKRSSTGRRLRSARPCVLGSATSFAPLLTMFFVR